MSRTNRLALLLAGVLVVALAGTALAQRAPVADTPAPMQADEPEPIDAAAVDHAVDRLTDHGIDASRVEELATEHGVGGAVRILAWADELDDPEAVDDIIGKRGEGLGWGQIAKELGVHPGLGSIMGNGNGNGDGNGVGHGREGAPGQQKDRGSDD
jgi:hypothetical protein